MDCKVWLRKLLSDGDTHNVEKIRKLRREYGFTKAELKAAKKELGVIVTNDSHIQDNIALNWFWQLPPTEQDGLSEVRNGKA